MQPSAGSGPLEQISGESKRFAIAVSFPGEDREFVLNVVTELASELGKENIFYDEWYEHELVGVDGDLKLRKYYREQSKMIVPFFSKHYQKPWCGIEWSAIRGLLLTRRNDDLIIPVALDDTVIEGWEPNDFAIRRKQRSPSEVAQVIVKAFRYRERTVPSSATTAKLIHLTEDELTEAGKALDADDLEQERQLGIQNLKASVVEILRSRETREFILQRNQLPVDLPPEELVAKIFAVIP